MGLARSTPALAWAALALVTAGLAPARAGAAGTIRTIAGVGQRGYRGDGGPAASAALDEPRAVAVDRAGNVYIADTFNHRIRRIDPSGIVTTLAGTRMAGFSGDGGPAEAAALNWPHAVALDAAEANLYIADAANHRIRKVDLATRVITTVAGNGEGGFAGDGGPATQARLNDPKGVAVGPGGDLSIADSANDRIRRVDPSGVIATVAGTGATGYGGDGGPAVAALLNGPRSLALDGAGNLYVADDNNDRVRRIDPTGVITTYAGTGSTGFSSDGGPAGAAQLARPRGVAVDAAGNVYVADCMNHRIRMVDGAGTISTVAGSRRGYGGDGGPAAKARLFLPAAWPSTRPATSTWPTPTTSASGWSRPPAGAGVVRPRRRPSRRWTSAARWPSRWRGGPGADAVPRPEPARCRPSPGAGRRPGREGLPRSLATARR